MTSHEYYGFTSPSAWEKGKLVGQKAPLRVRDIWAIRVRLQLAEKTRNLALFNLAIVPEQAFSGDKPIG